MGKSTDLLPAATAACFLWTGNGPDPQAIGTKRIQAFYGGWSYVRYEHGHWVWEGSTTRAAAFATHWTYPPPDPNK